MPTIGDQATAKQRAEKVYRQRLVVSGTCVKCAKRPSKPDAQRCGICTAKAAESAQRRRQGRPVGQKGPQATRGVHGWNFETDDLITEHIKLAKAMAWKAKARIPSSSTIDIDDMVGDALYGLVIAGRTFDESYQVPFGSWASTQIRGEIYSGMRRWTKGYQKHPPQFVELSDE